MSRTWFGTDGVRGPAGEGALDAPFLRRLGQALGERASGAPAGAEVLIARDTRASGPAITHALAHGLLAGGADVVDLGVLPTPGLPMAMRARGAAYGLVVSASHNPWRDNGVKVFGPGGTKLTDDQEHALEARIAALGGADADDLGDLEQVASVEVRTLDGASDYVAEMLDRFERVDLTGVSLAIDCAHGAASFTAERVLTGLGAEVTSFFAEPDGQNINDGCGSTHLGALAASVRDLDVLGGLAFDGDADRVLLVDARGREANGDHMLAFLGGWLASEGRLPDETVVATVMSNLGLERRLGEDGIRLLRTSVGDRYVHAAMHEGGYGLGGEASGHLLFGAEHDYTGDGLYTALRVLEGLRATGRDMASLIDAVPAVPQVLLNVPVATRPALDDLPAVTDCAARHEAEHGDALRIVLRYSGTEDLARVMVEGLDAAVVDAVAAELAALWPREIERQVANAS